MTEVDTDTPSPPPARGHRSMEAPPLGMSENLHLQRAQKKINKLLWGIFILLLVLVGSVIFVLPGYMSRVRPVATTVAVTPPAAAVQAPAISPFEEAQRLRQREAAQNTLAALLELQDTLETRQVLLWSDTAFNEALAFARSGDGAYATQQFIEANTQYQSGVTLLQEISASEPALYAKFMEDAAGAYQAGDAVAAESAYGLALVLNPDSADAVTGMERARVLKEVQEVLRNGRELQAANQLEEARALYQQALALDNAHADANAALAEVNRAIVDRNFASAMSRGYAALQTGQAEAAQSAFQQALAIKPGASEVTAAMQQARDQQTFAAITVHITAAEQHEADENWQEAVASWEQALTVDPNLVSAQDGKRRSEGRNNLDVFLVATINDPLRLAEDNIHAQTLQVVSDAEQVANPGPKLLNQLQQVRDFLARIRIPATVQLQSDGLTTVTLYRVGELGLFTSHTLSLTPGNYIAVGVRPGYQDVRTEFVVGIDGQVPVVSVVCAEAI